MEKEIAALASDLIRIDSVNPSLHPASAGESGIAAFVSDWFSQHGIETTVQEVASGRPNVVGRVRGTGGGRTLMLNAHTDTVTLDGPLSSLDPVERDGRLHGRGSFDMKGSLAAAMLTAADYSQQPGRGDLLVTAVIDEEYASLGTSAIVDAWTADAAIVTEPTGLELSLAHKGFVWADIVTRGRAAHGSLPSEGIDAIARMGEVLTGMTRLDSSLRAIAPHPLLGTGSIHGSLIEGGNGLSTYPDCCRLTVERRTIPGETDDQVLAELRSLLPPRSEDRQLADDHVDITLSRSPFQIDPSHPFVDLVKREYRATLGHAPIEAGESGWMDSALLAEAGIPTVILGPQGDGAHAAVEWVDLASLAECRALYLSIARSFCE